MGTTFFVVSTYKTNSGDIANPTVTRKTSEASAVAEFHSKMSSLIKEASTVMVSCSILDEFSNQIRHECFVKETEPTE